MLRFRWSRSNPSRNSGDSTRAALADSSAPCAGRGVPRTDHESPKRDHTGVDRGLVGSSPLKTPPSSVSGPLVAAAITTSRSRICAMWWLTGYFTNGRAIGSSLPKGANPRPPAIETARRCPARSEEHTSELQSRQYLVCRLLLEKKNTLKVWLPAREVYFPRG